MSNADFERVEFDPSEPRRIRIEPADLDRARGSAASGPRPAGPNAVSDPRCETRAVGPQDAGAVCPYAGDEFRPDDRLAICTSCGTSHLELSWIENGGCTTYGCSNAPDFRKDSMVVDGRAIARNVPPPPPSAHHRRLQPTSSVMPIVLPSARCVCGYAISGLSAGVSCPECGAATDRFRDRVPEVSMTLPIVASVFSCGLLGILAIVYALQANEARLTQDWMQAETSSRRCRLWCIISFIPLLLLIAVLVLAAITG